jgi:hypothetical protein
MKGVALDELCIVALPAGLHCRKCSACFEYIFARCIEQSKRWVKGRGLMNGSRFRLRENGGNTEEGSDCDEQYERDEEIAL